MIYLKKYENIDFDNWEEEEINEEDSPLTNWDNTKEGHNFWNDIHKKWKSYLNLNENINFEDWDEEEYDESIKLLKFSWSKEDNFIYFHMNIINNTQNKIKSFIIHYYLYDHNKTIIKESEFVINLLNYLNPSNKKIVNVSIKNNFNNIRFIKLKVYPNLT